MEKAIFLLSLVLIIFSCKHAQQNSKQQTIDTLPESSEVHNSFLDSVLAKAEFSSAQIKKLTLIDTSSFGFDNVTYRGDTVYYPTSKHPLVSMVKNDATCSHFYLLVFNKSYTTNTACKLVKNDCDYDDQSFSTIDFTIINDSLFYIKDVYIKMFKNDDKEPQRTVTGKHYYKITPNGKIASFNVR